MHRTVLVVPCFNEEARLPRDAFLRYVEGRDWLTVLFVDDGSTDGTREMLERLCDVDPARFRLLTLPRNGGKAEAVRQGVLAALAGMHAESIGFWDADLATPLETLEDFRDVLQRYPAVQMVMGSRVQLLGRSIQRDRRRHYFGRVAATGVSTMLGLCVYDTQCGAKLFRVTPTLRTLFDAPFITRWVFDVEILARFILAHPGRPRAELEASIHEFPLMRWTDVKGSRLKPVDFVKAPVELLRIWRRYFGR